VDVKALITSLNEALRLIEQGRSANLDLAETKIDAIIASAPELEGKISSINTFRWLKAGLTITLLAASAILAKRYGPKTFWNLWLKVMRDWTVHT